MNRQHGSVALAVHEAVEAAIDEAVSLGEQQDVDLVVGYAVGGAVSKPLGEEVAMAVVSALRDLTTP